MKGFHSSFDTHFRIPFQFRIHIVSKLLHNFGLSFLFYLSFAETEEDGTRRDWESRVRPAWQPHFIFILNMDRSLFLCAACLRGRRGRSKARNFRSRFKKQSWRLKKNKMLLDVDKRKKKSEPEWRRVHESIFFAIKRMGTAATARHAKKCAKKVGLNSELFLCAKINRSCQFPSSCWKNGEKPSSHTLLMCSIS